MQVEQVTVYLGETSERAFTVEVVKRVFKGDYYTPSDIEYEVSQEVYDAETGEDCSKLIERWENLYKEDFNSLAIEEFISNY